MRITPAGAPTACARKAIDLAAELQHVLGDRSYNLSQAETKPSVVIQPLGHDWRPVLRARTAEAPLTFEGGADMVADTIHNMSHDFDDTVIAELERAARLLCGHCRDLNVMQGESTKDGVVTIVTVLFAVTADNQQLGIVFDRFAEYC